MLSWFPSLVLGLFLGVVLRIAYRRWRKQRIAARRVVERPNSHYSSQGVRNHEDRDRWGRINLGRLHPLNQEEVERLLDLIDREGVNAISKRDRLFLDNMSIPRLG